MNVRKVSLAEIDIVMSVYAHARTFMRQTGNVNQWINGYPCQEIIIEDILKENSYACVKDDGEIVGVFCFRPGKDATYSQIHHGHWLNNRPYGVVHRLASSGKETGVAVCCLDWCLEQHPNIRIDTHQDNIIMRHILTKHGFTYCGVIYIANGTARLAFQKRLRTRKNIK
jgi:hypothetical protein